MVYFMLTNGFEEVEAIAPIDILRRAGVELRTVGITDRTVVGSHGVSVVADCIPSEISVEEIEMIVLPGGAVGTQNLYHSDFVKDVIKYCVNHDRYIAAICAAPSIILGGMGLLHGREATCYPGMEQGMEGSKPQNKPFCKDGKIITGQAAGSALDFAFELCSVLKGQQTADKVRHEIYYANRC